MPSFFLLRGKNPVSFTFFFPKKIVFLFFSRFVGKVRSIQVKISICKWEKFLKAFFQSFEEHSSLFIFHLSFSPKLSSFAEVGYQKWTLLQSSSLQQFSSVLSSSFFFIWRKINVILFLLREFYGKQSTIKYISLSYC